MEFLQRRDHEAGSRRRMSPEAPSKRKHDHEGRARKAKKRHPTKNQKLVEDEEIDTYFRHDRVEWHPKGWDSNPRQREQWSPICLENRPASFGRSPPKVGGLKQLPSSHGRISSSNFPEHPRSTEHSYHDQRQPITIGKLLAAPQHRTSAGNAACETRSAEIVALNKANTMLSNLPGYKVLERQHQDQVMNKEHATFKVGTLQQPGLVYHDLILDDTPANPQPMPCADASLKSVLSVKQSAIDPNNIAEGQGGGQAILRRVPSSSPLTKLLAKCNAIRPPEPSTRSSLSCDSPLRAQNCTSASGVQGAPLTKQSALASSVYTTHHLDTTRGRGLPTEIAMDHENPSDICEQDWFVSDDIHERNRSGNSPSRYRYQDDEDYEMEGQNFAEDVGSPDSKDRNEVEQQDEVGNIQCEGSNSLDGFWQPHILY